MHFSLRLIHSLSSRLLQEIDPTEPSPGQAEWVDRQSVSPDIGRVVRADGLK